MDNNRLISKIAHLYYYQDMDLKEISKIFNISYATVSRLLKQGRNKGLIKIIIENDFERTNQLEYEIKKKFNLNEVFSVKVDKNFSEDTVLNLVGKSAADYLKNILKKENSFGVSWGRSVYNVVNNLSINKKIKLNLVQLMGQIPGYNFDLSSLEFLLNLSKKFQGNCFLINADAIVENKKIKNFIINKSSVGDTFNAFKSIDIALTSVGLFDNSMIKNLFLNNIRNEEKEELESKRIIGMNLFIFYDINGKIHKTKFNDRIISISAKDFLKIHNKIVVASGLKKIPALLGALRANLINTLFIDNITLEELIKSI